MAQLSNEQLDMLQLILQDTRTDSDDSVLLAKDENSRTDRTRDDAERRQGSRLVHRPR